MTSTGIVKMAASKDIDLIAVCDHNSAQNAEAVIEAGKKHGVWVIPGLEVTSSEEVHILGLFEKIEDALSLQQFVYDNLEGVNDEDVFGPQVLVDGAGEYTEMIDKLLIGATSLPLQAVVSEIKNLDGLAVASHINREGFSIVGQLGFIPDDLPLDGLEVSPTADPGVFRSNYPQHAILCGSDAHSLDNIGKCFTLFDTQDVSFEEVRLAIRGEKGRRIVC
jgi:hypothetical protein